MGRQQRLRGVTSRTDVKGFPQHSKMSYHNCTPAIAEMSNFTEVDDYITLQVGVAQKIF